MAYDEALAERIRAAVAGRPGVTEKAMFGGLAFLSRGKMFVGVVKDELMVRVGKERHGAAVARPHARTMDFTGRPMQGYVFVAAPGVAKARDVASWVEWGFAAVEALGAKAKPGQRTGRGASRRRPGLRGAPRSA